MKKPSISKRIKKRKKFNKICKDIKKVKIQGASNVAKKALEAYYLFPTKKSGKKLLKLRPTEPMLENVLKKAIKGENKKEILVHFQKAQEKINSFVYKKIKNNSVIFTHCHSTNVINALIEAKEKGKKFEVYNTETRPLYQGRKTAKQLENAGIAVTMFVDSAIGVALDKEQGTKKVNLVLLGADALNEKGIVNKVGSETIARIAQQEKIPVYIVADSWKYSERKIPLENRKLNEIWDKAPKDIKINNPSFEFVSKKYLSGIITELGSMKYETFLKKVRK